MRKESGGGGGCKKLARFRFEGSDERLLLSPKVEAAPERNTVPRHGQRNTRRRVRTARGKGADSQRRNRQGRGRPPESPSQSFGPFPSLPPPPKAAGSLDEEEEPWLRTQPNVTAFAPPRSEATRLTSRGGTCRRPPLLTRCYQACAQPISSRRRRRPAFELRTATSCCLASTQCNAVCLSALRHKGTAILWLSWTCTKMPGAHRAAACANYRAALYFNIREPKKGRWERGKGVLIFQVSIRFSVFSKIPILKNYQHHKMAAT